jgi:hypothetical protein
VALRRAAQQYQFVCPKSWNDQFAAPVAALADGTIVVGATDGLMLLSDDGSLRPHPDLSAIGRSSDVVRSPRGVFSLRPTPEGSEVLAIDAQTVRVLWKDTKSLYSLAALDDTLVLLRVNGTMLEQVTIAAADGAELERQTALVDLPVDYVFARANAGEAYALVVHRNGTVALGSLRSNTFTKLADGELSIAGPLSSANGTLLAVDGKLTQLVGGQATPLADEHSVVCLAEHDGLTYACETDGIARLSGQALGEPLFRFEWLVAPDLTRIPEGEERFLCNSQWQDLRFDLTLLRPDSGGAPADPSLAGTGLGAQPPLATGGVGAAAGGGGAAAGGAAAAGSGGPGVGPSQQPREGGTSCATLLSKSAPRAADAFAFSLVVALAVVRCRRGRRRSPSAVVDVDLEVDGDGDGDDATNPLGL